MNVQRATVKKRTSERCWFCDGVGGESIIVSPMFKKKRCYVCFKCIRTLAILVLIEQDRGDK
jgi:hypothetical protein